MNPKLFVTASGLQWRRIDQIHCNGLDQPNELNSLNIVRMINSANVPFRGFTLKTVDLKTVKKRERERERESKLKIVN